MNSPSKEATLAYADFFRKDPSICYYLPFLKDLIFFLVDDFDIQIDLNALPTNAEEETVHEEAIRTQVLSRLLEEFKQEFGDPFSEPAFLEEEGIEGYAYTRIIEAFYFCLDRRQRKPSNANREPHIKTARELRREKWTADIEERYRQGERIIQRAISRAQVAESEHGPESDSQLDTDTDTEPKKRMCPKISPCSGRLDSRMQPKRKKYKAHLPPVTGYEAEIPFPAPLELCPKDRQEILRYLILKVRELHGERYKEFFETKEKKDLCTSLEQNLVPRVRAISDSGSFSLEGIRSIGGDTKSTGAGIYMNIIWDPENHQQFWLYVGQATNLERRIADHNDKLYRKKHPSLHYHVWDAREEMRSQFVVLATVGLKSQGCNVSRFDQCLLNMQEMWMACLFQTLTARDLDKYLSPSVGRAASGRHLNVVPPVWQRFQDERFPDYKETADRPKFEEFLNSDSPAIREWAKAARDSYNDLRNSPDPQLRQYWFDNNRRQLKSAWDANDRDARDSLKIYQITGKEEVVHCSPNHDRGYITCGKFYISLPQALNIRSGSKVHVQFHLYDTTISHRYAQKALGDDPSSRLAISIKGSDASGCLVHVWLQSLKGERLPMRMNSLVDALEGLSFNETCLLRRRWIVKYSGEGSQRETRYTG